MNVPIVYELHWKSMPMGAIRNYGTWYYPWLGSGIYMWVVAKTDQRYVGFYVGKADDIGKRWYQHVNDQRNGFLHPNDEYSVAENAGDFLKNPVAVINNEAFRPGLPNRAEIQRQILDQSWFTFAEAGSLHTGHRLDNLEYVLQEGLKTHAGIGVYGYIGEGPRQFRHPPTTKLTILNQFGRPFLERTLPVRISFDPDDPAGISLG